MTHDELKALLREWYEAGTGENLCSMAFDLTACETVEIPPHETRAVSLGLKFLVEDIEGQEVSENT